MKEEKCVVETSNRFALINYHTNYQLLTRSDQAGPAEDYFIIYFKKYEVMLEGAAPAMLEAMNHIQ